ncbi:MAG: sigma-70 family RNA polymerase sigma factor [Clostridia bacterium]|nr:sigma-70 family RNA polymerase sigma factor [Clostridia bacterium]
MAKKFTREAIESLLLRVREEDQKAFAELLSVYEPLVGSEVARHSKGLGAQDAEDLRQVALLAVCRAARNFDLSQSEVEFGLYAKVCVTNALASQLRVIRRRLHEVSADSAFFTQNLPDREDPARRIMEEEALSALHARIRAVLSPYENCVWALHAAGYRTGEIAKCLAKDPHSVENAVYRIHQKLRRELGSCD